MSPRPLVCAKCGAPLTSDGNALLLKCSYCGQAHEPSRPAAASPSDEMTYEGGQAVCVEWGGRFWPGRILRCTGPQRWEIAYDSWPSDWNEIVGPDRLRASARTRRRSASLVIASVSVVAVIACAVAFAVSARPTHGHEPEAARSAAQSAQKADGGATTEAHQPFAVGAEVEAEWRGKWYPAKILALESGQRFRIHYSGWGSEWDEVVEPGRLRHR
jgi:hypothetical protein